jgi:hypothetical protein
MRDFLGMKCQSPSASKAAIPLPIFPSPPSPGEGERNRSRRRVRHVLNPQQDGQVIERAVGSALL